jgi:hypothetical protein
MYSVSDLQKLVQMLDYLGFAGNIAPPHSVVIGGGWVTPGASGTLFASNGPSADPSFQTFGSLGIQPALGYTPAHSGANSDITSLLGLSTPLSIPQGGTGAATAALARAALGAAASGANTDITSLASPAIGSATATTQARGTNSTDVATTEFVLKQAPFLNILDFGGDNTGVSDNAAALNAALSSALQFTGRVVVYFPPGKYIFNSTITYTFPNAGAHVSIFGAGTDITELCWPAASIGLQFNFLGSFNGVFIKDLSLTCGTTGSATAIYLNQTATSIPNPANSSLNQFTNLMFRGSDGYLVTFGWGKGVDSFAVSFLDFINCTWVGSLTGNGLGIDLHGLNSGCQGVGANLVNCNFNYLAVGINYREWWQGLSCNQTGFTGGGVGISSPSNPGGTDSLICTGCAFNTTIAGLQTTSPVANLQLVGNLFFSLGNNTVGVNLTNYSSFTCVGNIFQGSGGVSGQVGIGCGTLVGPSGGTVVGNNFFQLGTAVVCSATSTLINVQSNAYNGNSTNVNNSGVGNTIGGGSI